MPAVKVTEVAGVSAEGWRTAEAVHLFGTSTQIEPTTGYSRSGTLPNTEGGGTRLPVVERGTGRPQLKARTEPCPIRDTAPP